MNPQPHNRRRDDYSAVVGMDAAERREILIGAHKVASLTVKPARCGEVDWPAFWAQQPVSVSALAL